MTRGEDEVSMTDLAVATVMAADMVIATVVVVRAATWSPLDAEMVGIVREIVTVTVTATAIGNETEAAGTTTDLATTIAENVGTKVATRTPESYEDTKLLLLVLVGVRQLPHSIPRGSSITDFIITIKLRDTWSLQAQGLQISGQSRHISESLALDVLLVQLGGTKGNGFAYWRER